MSDLEDNEDLYDHDAEGQQDPERVKADLFGEEIEEDETPSDRRAALQKLSQKRRREQEEEEEEQGTHAYREPLVKEGSAARAAFAEDEEEEEDLVRTAEDDAFIDDAGVDPEDIDGYAEAGDDVEEAEEVDNPEEEEDPFGRKKRKKNTESDSEIEFKVNAMLSRMEVCVEQDIYAYEAKEPALSKLQAVKDVEVFLTNRKYHQIFLQLHGLSRLSSWLKHYPDGSLPNTRVRSAVLRILQNLPIDTTLEEYRTYLKESQIGLHVMFLYKCPDETPANKRIAKDLVEKWSRPIFRREDDFELRQQREQEKLKSYALARKAQQQQEKATQQVQEQRSARQGEAGFRWHAAIPQASKLDYVKAPEGISDFNDNHVAAGPKQPSRFAKKMREISRKQKETTARAAKPSVEGRGLVMFH